MSHHAPEEAEGPPAKKRRTLSSSRDLLEAEDLAAASAPVHPLGVKPLGNAYKSDVDLRRSSGVFARLPEDLFFQILETLDSEGLVGLGTTCKAMYAFSRAEELWKALFVECVCLDRITNMMNLFKLHVAKTSSQVPARFFLMARHLAINLSISASRSTELDLVLGPVLRRPVSTFLLRKHIAVNLCI